MRSMWVTKPEFLVSVLMFVVGTLISVYGPETRRLLALPGERWRRLRQPATKTRIEVVELRIRFAEQIHGNAYELLFFIANAFLRFINSFFRSIVYLFVPAVLFEVFSRRWFKAGDILWPLFIGSFVGFVGTLSVVFRDLRDFPNSVNRYKAELVKLRADDGARTAAHVPASEP